MCRKFFVTATNTNIGKTYFVNKMIRLFPSIVAMKPIETGFLPSDAISIQRSMRKNGRFYDIDRINPYHFSLPASPFVSKDRDINIKNIDLIDDSDILLIEGAGGLLVPIERDYFMLDMAIDMRVDGIILISNGLLGSINDIMLNIELFKSRNIKNYYIFINLTNKNEFYKITYPYIKNIDNIIINNYDEMFDILTK
jgi:dethiobiotin synthetase